MCVLQGDAATVRASYVADDDPTLDWISSDEPCDLGMGTWRWIVECAASVAFIQGDTPTISVWTGCAAPPHQSSKAEADIRRHIGIHS
jgi:hypothetical protein